MFIFKYFKDSFDYKNILIQKDKSLIKLFIFFILMIIIANFPVTYDAYIHEGSRLDFIIEDFSKEQPLDWVLPNDISIKGGTLVNNGIKETYTYEHKGITYIINNLVVIDAKENKNSVVFNEKSIVYIDKDANVLEGFNYKGFSDEFYFRELNLSSDAEKRELYEMFAHGIEKSFSNDIILYTVLRNIILQIGINLLYILILSLFVQLFKFGYQNFLSYKEGLMFVLNSIGLPAIISFIIGIISPPFAPVAFQLSSGMVIMLVILTQGKRVLY